MREANEIGIVSLASTFRHRAMGLFSKGLKGDVLLIAPCHSIHTFGMNSPIDVAFIGWDGRVLKACRALPSGRMKRCRGAYAVLERKVDWSQGAQEPWFEEGEEVILCIRK